MEAERDGYRQQLSVAEKRLDRVQSGVVNGLHSKPLNGEVKLEQPPQASASPVVSSLVYGGSPVYL